MFGKTIRLCVLLIMTTAMAAGCGRKVKIYQFPQFYTPDLKSIAVVPFRSTTSNDQAGVAVSETFARALMQNNTYRVFSQNDLGALVDHKDLMLYASSGDASAVASKFRPGGKVQALMVGTVTIYNHTSNTQRREEPQYTYDSDGNAHYAGTSVYSYTRNEATVAVSAALIRVSDGTQVYATPQVTGRDTCEGKVPARDRFECLRRATQKAIDQLVTEFAVTQREIRVTEKNLRIASENYDAQWKPATRFSPSDKTVYVVLQLPESCDRNRFRIVVTREEQRDELAAVEVTYERNWTQYGKGFEFSPKELAAKGGQGAYTAKLYSGPEAVIISRFEIR